MKKVLSIIMTVVAMLAIAATTVNASSVSVDKAEIAKGDKVVVSFNTTDAKSVQFDLKYDSSKFELDKVSADNEKANVMVSSQDENTIRVVFIDMMRTETVNKINASFIAKADAEGTADFTVSNVTVDPADEVATPTATVTIAQPADNQQSDEPAVDPEQAANNDNQQSADNSSAKPTKLPQTGTPVVAMVAGIAVVLIAAVAIRKIVK